MATIFDINPSDLIPKAAEELKKSKAVKTPEWAKLVKTGPGQERPPVHPDWWYHRAASILRKISLKGPIGVSKLRNYYGTKKNRGVKPEQFYRASGKIIRVILQQLETEGLIKKVEKGVHKGKVLTPKGQAFLDSIAKNNGPRRNKKAETGKTAAGTDAEPVAGAAPSTAAA
ncbi:30S ribosomal protein S19e [Candidatus Woesearchaeota archaeon]|nr:30S ribosomal protein S19e [Candidatus Woesearchaeota archaeon]